MATTKFDVSSLLDKDLIVNQGTSGTDTIQDGIDYMGSVFVTQTFATSQDATNGNGLPDNGIFAANSYHPEIQLSYSNDNDGTNGRLISGFSTTARTQTFQFNVTTGQYGYVHLALSPNGHAPMDVSLTFNYSDGSSQTSSTVTVPDWQDTTTTESENLYYLASGLDLSTNDGSLFLEDSVAVFGVRFAADATKTLNSITVNATSNYDYPENVGLAFFGATGESNPNAVPTLTSSNAASIVENTTTVLTVAATDTDGDTLTYSLTGGDDQSKFSINSSSGALTFTSAPDYETPTDSNSDNIYQVEVTADDGKGGTAAQTISVTVTDEVENQAPTAVTLSNSTATLAEDADTTNGIKVADIAITDDGVGTNNLSLTGADAGSFEISGSALYLKAGTTLDFATKSSYDVTVEVDDTTVGATPDATTAYSLSITEVGVNAAPTAVNLNNTTTSLPEDTNTTSALKVADIAITDDGVGTNNLSLTGADAGSFEISGSELYLKAGTTLDFATKSSYDVTVEVDDTTVGATPDATTAYSLGITEVGVNAAPTAVNLNNTTTSLPEETNTTSALKVA
ncbi:cadherin repeat domain-containing protein, partial [Oscillatoria sp. HE19RPO]|uniref:cadherin repeat domain-containing protein n=1 Tax=Oscillatoria sp. HE19RPO TaxID=2954806 RepID=UPI0020C2F587